MRMRRVTVDANGLRCEAYTWDQTERVEAAWGDVFLISCGRLELQQVTEAAWAPSSGSTFIMPRALVTETHYEYLLDIVLFDLPSPAVAGFAQAGPWRRLLLDQNAVGFSLTEMRKDPERALGDLYRSSLNLERFAQGVPMNRGISLLANGGSEAAWQSLTFLSKRDFESYT
jgi:hypothetical protein